MKPMNILIDTGVALSLVLALALVYGLDKSPDKPKVTLSTMEGGSQQAKPLRLAVTPKHWDDMGSLLNKLGKGFSFTPLEDVELLNADRLRQFDVVFLTCRPVAMEGSKDPDGFLQWNDRNKERLKDALRQFVRQGGTLYASDQRYPLLLTAFPEFFEPGIPSLGAAQPLTADVIDPGLRDLIGSQIALKFDLDSWFPGHVRPGQDTKVILQGQYRAMDGRALTAPLLFKKSFEQGTVIFTSFHNGKQNSEEELKLLRYLVFRAVTARVESEVAGSMLKGGFSPQKQNLLSASAEAPSVTQTYRSKKDSTLRFVLGFENQGAELSLTVVSPSGQKHEKRGTSTLEIEVPNAPAGDWQYTVTAIKVPYPNFPFTLTVGEK